MKKNDSPSVAVLKSVLGGKVVSYHPVFARALRNVSTAVMLSQGYFWQENAHHKDLKEIDGRKYFTATADEWYESTGVTPDAQVTARKVLCDSGFWGEKRAGVPAKLYFYIDIEILVSVIYGYLNSGIQVSVDNRCKSREYTRSSDGTFRQPVSVIYGNTIKVESIETNKRVEESSDARAENQPDVEKEKGKKAPQVAGAPPAGPTGQKAVPTTFSQSIWSTATTGAFAQALHDYAPETADADAGYYRIRCRDWSAQNPNKLKPDWIAFAAQIINDDRGKNKLVTIQPISHNGTNHNHHSAGSAGEPLLDYDNVKRRAAAIADRWKAKNPGRYQ